MFKNLRNIFKQTAIYSLGNLSLKLIGLVLLPIYTSYLTTSDYGALALLEVTSTLAVAFFSFKLSTSMMRWCSDTEDTAKRKSIVFTNYSFSILIIIVLNIILYFLYDQLSMLYFGSHGYEVLFIILFISASFEIMNYYPFELLRFEEKSIFYILITIFRLILVLVLNIVFIVKLEMGIKGILLSQLIGQILIYIYTLPFMIRRMSFTFNFNELKDMINYGFPLVFASIAMMLLNLGDRYIIKYLRDFSDVGIYSLGYKIGSVINVFVIQSFNIGFLPIAYKMYDKKEANRFFSKTLTYYVMVLVIFSYVVSAFSKEVIESFARNDAFFIAYKLVPLLTFVFIIRGIQYVFALGLHFVKKTQYNAVMVVTISLVNIGLNFLLIPKLGIYGAALSTILCWIILTLLFYRISMRFYPVNYEMGKIFLLIIVFILFNVLAYMVNDLQILLRICIKLGLLVLIPVILIPFRFYEKIEIERLSGAWNKWKKIRKWPEYISKIKL